MQPPGSQKSKLNATLPSAKAVSVPVERATIGRSLVIKGEISGAESLYIDGRVEGAIDFAGHAVTVSVSGTVAASISAREVVILGKVQGNIKGTECVDIRTHASVSGDVVTQHISVEEGAILEGSIEVRAVEQKADPHKQARADLILDEAKKPITTEQPRAAAAAAGSQTSFHSVHGNTGPSFADSARTLISAGYKPKDAVEVVLQQTAFEYRSDPSIMEKARIDAAEFLLKMRKGLI
jgi:cytoskeletal protein CcmA (bactofilin family)